MSEVPEAALCWIIQIDYTFPHGDFSRWWIDNFIMNKSIYLSDARGAFAEERAIFSSGDMFLADSLKLEEEIYWKIKVRTNLCNVECATIPERFVKLISEDDEMKKLVLKMLGTGNEYLWMEIREFLLWF